MYIDREHHIMSLFDFITSFMAHFSGTWMRLLVYILCMHVRFFIEVYTVLNKNEIKLMVLFAWARKSFQGEKNDEMKRNEPFSIMSIPFSFSSFRCKAKIHIYLYIHFWLLPYWISLSASVYLTKEKNGKCSTFYIYLWNRVSVEKKTAALSKVLILHTKNV